MRLKPEGAVAGRCRSPTGACYRLIALKQPSAPRFDHFGTKVASTPSPLPLFLAQYQDLEKQFRLEISQSLISRLHQKRGLSKSHLWLIAPKPSDSASR